MCDYPEVYIHPTCAYVHSIQDGETILEQSSGEYLSSSYVAEWLEKSPRARATLTLFDETIELPMYTLRRRNAIVADLPEAPLICN
ncbi:hypothetical protein G6F57_000560 [Rhizopus arrhizus]|jgi:hypothetical protein|uniref:Uncharacterized protein n=1 Tax=Rhizopus oryzae TaxID=64495 RepID=A0A9P6XKP5_RHIOR|nr:hypothetical protein G6F23_005366 [Rhizopus arrhizus]KAG1429326.1 hypothetical protein G6F58_000105 [Rhizopus delemar]KAG0770233.1 hypothetical protein G6F24_000403 [Rhizopus arrhizus]KAG0792492.1 hypothetical protein G6F22_005850 [Rhizopus arrhizus]KAG0797197.1 hypothetical protein G6F21_000704 [Rhizopus arrhizus]